MSKSFHDRLADLARPPETLKPDLPDMERRAGRRKGRKRLGSGVTATVVALAATVFLVRAFAQPTPQVPVGTPSPTVSNGKIGFARYSDGGWQIETINPDGTSGATLTNVPGNALHPAWSPDGHRILFDVQSGGGRMQIFVVNDDGTGLTQLTNDLGWNYLPAWSSDGSKIAFVSTRDGNDEIYVMNADGSTQARLTVSPDEDLNPSWAPGGSQIAFQSNRQGNNEIYVMNADGSDVTRLTDDAAAFDGQPEWSPDGKRIAFASDRDGSGLYTMNTDGKDIVQLTHDANVSLDPEWSPDGASIVYATSVDGSNRVGIFVVDVNTRSRQALLGAVGDVCCPTWQPMGGVDHASVARYFFSASGIGGVLEVSSSPPSICYSTQTASTMPISIISAATGHVEVSYAPSAAHDFCDGTVRVGLASDLIDNPSAYQVSWNPTTGGRTVLSSFTGATVANGWESPATGTGYWVRFPDAPEPVGGGPAGAVRIVALTNLPEGTSFGVNT